MLQRDSLNESLWQQDPQPTNTVASAPGTKTYDVIIVGGGITGLTTGLLLQKSGKTCLIIEAKELCFGTTGGTTAHLNTLLDTPYTTITKNFSEEASRAVAAAAADAIQLIRDNIRAHKIECEFEETSAFLFADNEKQDKELKELAAAAADAGLKITFVQSIPIPSYFTTAIMADGQAKFHPTKYVFGLAKAFQELGGEILQHSRVESVDESEPLSVSTSTGTYHSNNLIYATHIPPGVNLLHLRCMPYRSYAMALKTDDENYPEGLTYDMYDPYFYYRTQIVSGEKFLIVGGKDHKTGTEENTEKPYLELEAKIRSLYNYSSIQYKWSSQFFEPTDGLPYIGHLPQHSDRIFVATGFGGNGMTYSQIAAMQLTAMINNTDLPFGTLFSPGRIKPIAGFTNFIKHNAGVAKEFVERLFSAEKLKQLGDLAPGEGKLVSFEGEKIGIYKSETGKLSAINPVCTHLKCEVKWNTAEKSWDCPCHGGRFDCEGKVLTGPASVDLEKINIAELMNEKS